MSLDVVLEFNEEGQPLYFIDEDGKYKWNYDDVHMADWKDDEAIGIAAMNATVEGFSTIRLHDGTDSVLFASTAHVQIVV